MAVTTTVTPTYFRRHEEDGRGLWIARAQVTGDLTGGTVRMTVTGIPAWEHHALWWQINTSEATVRIFRLLTNIDELGTQTNLAWAETDSNGVVDTRSMFLGGQILPLKIADNFLCSIVETVNTNGAVLDALVSGWYRRTPQPRSF